MTIRFFEIPKILEMHTEIESEKKAIFFEQSSLMMTQHDQKSRIQIITPKTKNHIYCLAQDTAKFMRICLITQQFIEQIAILITVKSLE